MSDAPDMSDAFGLGPYLRAQRRLAKLSLRQMADLAGVSNPYLSQIERGLHEPSVRILRSIAEALNLSAETVLEQAGLLNRDDVETTSTETAIRHDPDLTEDQKLALLSVYRSYRSSSGPSVGAESTPAGGATRSRKSASSERRGPT
jgi:transcriptional regulator with XRE-family HTH domain